jgi:two-component system sensor histidine kinase AtoS
MSNLKTKFNNYLILRNSSAIPFFYEKIVPIRRTFYNVIHQMSVGKVATGVFHDLMNPLTSLLLSIEITDLENKQEISKSSKELSKFVRVLQTQLRNTSSRERFCVARLIDDCLILIKYKALISGVRLIIAKDTKTKLYGNRIILMRAILNLINNAIESYEKCPKEQQDVVITLFEKDNFLNISVKDFGCGISKGDRKKIFRYFYTNKLHGTGIGLSTSCRSIRKEYSGKIYIDCKDDIGSTFVIKIPLKVSV